MYSVLLISHVQESFSNILKFLLLNDSSLQKKHGEEGYDFKLDFLNGYQGKNYLLYVDNFYTSELLIDLLKIGMYCTGTNHTNHKHFLELLPPNQSMAMGNYRFATSEKFSLTAAWWKDRRNVFIKSSHHKQATKMVLKSPKGSKDKTNIPCPSMILDYNYIREELI